MSGNKKGTKRKPAESQPWDTLLASPVVLRQKKKKENCLNTTMSFEKVKRTKSERVLARNSREESGRAAHLFGCRSHTAARRLGEAAGSGPDD